LGDKSLEITNSNSLLEDESFEITDFDGLFESIEEIVNIEDKISDNIYKFSRGTYYLLDGRINVRSEPSLRGEVLGQLNVNTEVKIVECAFNEQVIDGFLAYWYKIEYNNSFGYIWGGYIAQQTLVYDIDNNGTNDYFHYRSQKIWADAHGSFSDIVDLNKDIFIYINNTLINSTFEVERHDDRPYLYCSIYTGTDFLDVFQGWEVYQGWDVYINRIEDVIFQFYANPWVYFFEVNQYGGIQLIHVWAK
jgi:hypothetical protein